MTNSDLAPIILFVFNRPDHTKRTIKALQANDLAKDSLLYVFSDCAKREKEVPKVSEVRKIINNINGFKNIEIDEAATNKGCANSIISGIDFVINRHGKAIIVEDDVLTSPRFLNFINSALRKYENDKRIFSISGYNSPMQIPANYKNRVFLTYRCSSWGWGTWIDRWKEADWNCKGWERVFNDKKINALFRRGGDDLPYILKAQMGGTIDTWDIRWQYAHFLKNRYTLYPVDSFVENIGFDGSGIHCGNAKKAPARPLIAQNGGDINLPETLEFDESMNALFTAKFKYGLKDKIRRFLKELLRYKINKS